MKSKSSEGKGIKEFYGRPYDIRPMVERTRLINEYLDYKKHLIFPHWNLPTKKNPLIIKDNTK